MSGPRITDAAVEAGTEALAMDGDSDPSLLAEDEIELYFAAPVRKVLTAALPHIERAVIQRLIEKYEAKAREGAIYIDGVRQRSMFDKTVVLLRAELEGGDRG